MSECVLTFLSLTKNLQVKNSTLIISSEINHKSDLNSLTQYIKYLLKKTYFSKFIKILH